MPSYVFLLELFPPELPLRTRLLQCEIRFRSDLSFTKLHDQHGGMGRGTHVIVVVVVVVVGTRLPSSGTLLSWKSPSLQE